MSLVHFGAHGIIHHGFWYTCLIFVWTIFVLTIERKTTELRMFISGLVWLTFTTILIVLFFYDWHWCLVIACTGGLLNTTALLFNQRKMPVLNPNNLPEFKKRGFFPFGYYDWEGVDIEMGLRHKSIDSDTKFFILCDWIVLRRNSIASIGDSFIWISWIISLVHIILLLIY